MAEILYFSNNNSTSTSAQRAKALERIGHTVSLYNPAEVLTGWLGHHWVGLIHYRTGYRLVQPAMQHWLKQLLSSIKKPNLIWVNSGELLGPECLKILKKLGCPILLYNNDDPTGMRDGRRFDLLLQSLPYYDLCVVRRAVNVAEYKALGAKKTLLIHMSYDEVAHKPFKHIGEIPAAFRSEVAFIGTWMQHERRDEFLLELIDRGLPLSIWGDRWNKSPYFNKLKPYWRGPAIYGRDYVAGIQGAKISLGFLSKRNRDLHTRRSVEVPFAGGLLCAERTTEHLQMYQENVEAVFWSDAAACADACMELLASDEKREQIRQAGMQKVRNLALGNEAICRKIISTILPYPGCPLITNTLAVYEDAKATGV